MNNLIKRKLIIGTANFGLNYGIKNNYNKLSFEKIKKILNYAKKNKIQVIDTASSYGDAELKIGKVKLKNFKYISKVKITKKKNEDIKKEIYRQFNKTLNNLNQKKIYGILIHNLLKLNNNQIATAYESLNILKKNKKISKLGFSTYGDYKIKYILSKFNVDIIQTSANVIDNRAFTKELLDLYKRKKVKIHVRSIFLQGLLISQLLNFPKKIKNDWKKNQKLWFDFCNKKKIEPAKLALKYVLQKKNVDKIILGFDSKDQLVNILNMNNKKIKFNYPKFKKVDRIINPYMWF